MHLATWPRVLALAAPLLSLGLSACFMEVDDKPTPPDTVGVVPGSDGWIPAALASTAQSCDASPTSTGTATSVTPAAASGQNPPGCFQQNDFTWRTSCKSDQCQSIKVYTHYALQQDLGTGRVVHVEAFDNEHFEGAPAGTVRIANFTARPGEMASADLYLAPGQYYLRAYLTTDDDESTPYTFGDMQLVGDQPVGVYGALSGAQSVSVAPPDQNPYPPPVDIMLDKLFQKPGTQPDTHAHLRLTLGVDPGLVPDGRQVRIELRTSADLTTAPAAAFTLPTEELLVQGRTGHADFVTPSLPEGNYLVFVYIDANGNDLYDPSEPAAQYMQNGLPQAIAVRKDTTQQVALTLMVAGAAPTPAPSPVPAPTPSPAQPAPTPAPAQPAPTSAPAPAPVAGGSTPATGTSNAQGSARS